MTHDEARDMLSYIPAEDRDLWIRTGMALKDALGDSGISLFHEWSSNGSSYRESDCNSAWRSFKPGRITEKTLVWMAQQNGYQNSKYEETEEEKEEKKRKWLAHKRKAEEAERKKKELANSAAERAKRMLSSAKLTTHPYLNRKGFDYMLGFVDEKGRLLVPALNQENKIVAVQTITEDGEKRYQKGASMKGATHRIGRRRGSGVLWLVEGYATGKSVKVALSNIYRHEDEVRVCFDTGGIVREGKRLKNAFVVADNDENGAGEKAAQKSGHRYWLPPERGDANDFHMKHGIDALAKELSNFIYEERTR